MLKFSAAEITQLTWTTKVPGTRYHWLKGSGGEGCRRCLERQYMREVKEYLKTCEGQSGGRRLLFLAPSKKLARQAAMVVLKSGISHGQREEGDTYDYDRFFVPDPTTEDLMLQDILILSEGEHQDPAFLLPAEMLRMETAWREPKPLPGEKIKRDAESVLYELEGAEHPDDPVDRILELMNSNLFLWIRPEGAYEYMVRRLVFEGGFRVLRVEEPTLGDLLDCAKDFMAFHHFRAPEEELSGMLTELRIFRGELMEEQDIYRHLGRCFEKAVTEGKRELTYRELAVCYGPGEPSAKQELDRLVGLETIKRILDRRIKAKLLMKDRGGTLYGNYILEGAPGTGKSRVARLFAKRMAQEGAANGRFVDAARSDLIGKYVGHTASHVRSLFERADGGVLFIDEASFLTQEDLFVKEAVIELVRYMELCPRTTVIFATYPREAEALLDIDPGFRSRISGVLRFPDYSDEELCEIFYRMAQDHGFEAEEECRAGIIAYLDIRRKQKNFGNAREMRKLLEAAVEECGIRYADGGEGTLTRGDMERASHFLLEETKDSGFHIGFAAME